MNLVFFGFYAGPDQVMTVTSGLAGALGVVLIFWNKVVLGFHKVLDRVRGSSPTAAPVDPPQENERS
jgi:hypothetical protein